MSEVESVFFETDVFGSPSNVRALASWIDTESTTTDFAEEVEKAYTEEQYEAVEDIIRDMEDKALELGYTVVWDNGVYVYHSADLDVED